jgi:hypothetical protein
MLEWLVKAYCPIGAEGVYARSYAVETCRLARARDTGEKT